MQIAFLRPAPERRVRYPDHPARLLPDEGARVPLSPYWLRRLAAGDVLRAKHPPAKESPSTRSPERGRGRPEDRPEKTTRESKSEA